MGYELTTSQKARVLTKNDINTNEKNKFYVLKIKPRQTWGYSWCRLIAVTINWVIIVYPWMTYIDCKIGSTLYMWGSLAKWRIDQPQLCVNL